MKASDLLNQINPLHIYKVEPLSKGCVVFVDSSLIGNDKTAYFVEESFQEFAQIRTDNVGERATKSANRLLKAFAQK